MTAQVIFFPVKFSQSEENLRRLKYYQENLEIYHAELAYKTRGWTNWERMIYKTQSHQNIRSTWKLIKSE